MNKVMQTRFGFGGDCQSATIATLLGLGIDDVPYFFDGCDMEQGVTPENNVTFNDNVNKFLAQHGYRSITLGSHEPHVEWVTEISRALPDTKLLVNGISPRGYMHSVIYMNGKLWHDPHPEGGDVVAYSITFILPKF